MRNGKKGLLYCATALLMSAAVVQAQLTWDPDGNQVSDGGTGTWDTATGNWDDNGSAPNTIWVNGSSAVFGEYGTNYTVDLATGVEVVDLTYTGTNTLQLKSLVDNTALTLAGNAAWDTGGGEIEFLNDTVNDTALDLAGYTLTVSGGGLFDTGEKGNDANWGGGDLVFTEATTVRGASFSIGQLSNVTLAAGSTFIQERNAGQTFNNNWELGAGIVTFDNRYTRPLVFPGVVSGPGTLLVKDLGGTANDSRLQLNATNTFTGGIIVDSSNSLARLSVTDDFQLGAVPGAFDADNIVLRNGGMLKMTTFTLDSNRGITLENGVGGVILNSGASTINTPITGPGSFQVGWNGDLSGNRIILTSANNDYEGDTNIRRGTIQMGTNNVLPISTVMSIGGNGGACILEMNGFNQTLAGLQTTGGNTRRIDNNGGANATLTINVADGEDYTYNANFAGSAAVDIVKNGAGTQRFQKDTYNMPPASLTINEGSLFWNSGKGPTGLTTVKSGTTLGGIGTLNTNVVVESGASLEPGNPGGQNALKFLGNLDLSDMIDDDAGGLKFSFAAAPGFKDIIVVTNAAGTGTNDMDGPSFIDDLEWSDFTFTDRDGVESGTFPLLIADTLLGALSLTDRSGPVGDLGATGVLSASNNTIYITIDGADVSPYGNWARDHGLPQGAENEDSDGDGYDNLQEFAYGGDPTNSGLVGYAPEAELADVDGTNWLTLVYGYRSATNAGVTYECLTCDNLIIGAWTNIGITVLGTNTLDETFDTITNAIPVDGSDDYLGVFLEKQE